ncbi:hypothetical protein [Leucobacter sp. cx-169]|uniref:hypothetical protein n=1 Tax=Leucobacter sp. cx-169 TaxID=2770549 RepID=UPI00165DE302|nr:hypothetical protein [Leucobacter sp. cx-169]MBC9927182.1 hypothetical protein [Leucobacter sp. cx-169]
MRTADLPVALASTAGPRDAVIELALLSTLREVQTHAAEVESRDGIPAALVTVRMMRELYSATRSLVEVSVGEALSASASRAKIALALQVSSPSNVNVSHPTAPDVARAREALSKPGAAPQTVTVRGHNVTLSPGGGVAAITPSQKDFR